MKTRFVTIVINPSAGNGKAGRAAQSLLKKIKSTSDFELDIALTSKKEDAVNITRNAIVHGASMIIAVGGDGTINEVVNGFFKDGKPLNPLCELGIINCGTGGGYAKSLNTPGSIDQQIDLLLKPGFQAMDLGSITCHDTAGNNITRLFVNECQIGIGNEVAASVGKKSKIFGGKLAFGTAATFLAMIINPLKLKIGFDDGPLKEYNLIGLVVGNGTECAGGMKLTPYAKPDDGLFDVLSINNMTIAQRILNLSKVYSGKHIFSPHFSVQRCKKLCVTSKAGVSIEGDGEVLGYSPFNIEILASAIKVKTIYANN